MRKSRNYLMKCLGFVLLLGFISLGVIGGCGNNGGDGTQALTENDFANDSNLSANPEEGVVVVFLEPSETPEEDNLTGKLGFDVIPYRYNQDLNHTICFVDENVDSTHFIILQNSDGEEVLRAQANGGCITEVIEAGDYEMVLTHGEHVDKIETIFLIPAPEEEQVTKRNEFNQKEIKTANGFSYKKHRYLPGGLVKFFESISNVFTRPARAQNGTGTPSVNLTTLINTNACEGCNLIKVDLTRANLSEANLSEAVLFLAVLFQTNLSGANLSGACLTGAVLRGADLSGADLCGASLNKLCPIEGGPPNVGVSLGTNVGVDLSAANLSGANLSGADLTSSILTSAVLTEVTLDDTIFTLALWCDGLCICGVNSIDTCVGCAGIEICIQTS